MKERRWRNSSSLSGIQRSQLRRRPRLFFHTRPSYFGVSSGAQCHTITDVPSGWCGLHHSGSCRVTSWCMWSPKMSQTAPLRPNDKTSWNRLLGSPLNHIFRAAAWVTFTSRHSKHSGLFVVVSGRFQLQLLPTYKDIRCMQIIFHYLP